MSHEQHVCPKCGERMSLVPEREHQLFDVYAVEYICPNCLHVERVKVIELRREGWK